MYAKWAAEAAGEGHERRVPGSQVRRAEATQAHPDADAQRTEAEEAGLIGISGTL